MPLGSFKEIYWPSPTFISTFSIDSLPRRFLQTVAMTVPGSVVANGDPFCELEKGKLWLEEENNRSNRNLLLVYY